MDLVPETPEMAPETPLAEVSPTVSMSAVFMSVGCTLPAYQEGESDGVCCGCCKGRFQNNMAEEGWKTHADECTGWATGKLEEEKQDKAHVQLAAHISLQQSKLHFTGPFGCQRMVARAMSRWSCMCLFQTRKVFLSTRHGICMRGQSF